MLNDVTHRTVAATIVLFLERLRLGASCRHRGQREAMSRYVIVSGGGIGVTFAAELQRAGRDVLLVARGVQLAAVRAGGLQYAQPDGTRRLNLRAIGDPSEIELTADDVLVLATKTQDVEPAIAQWAPRPSSGWPTARPRPPGRASRPDAAERPRGRAGRAAPFRVGYRRRAVAAGQLRSGWRDQRARLARRRIVWLGAYPGGAHPALAAMAADLRAGNFETQVVADIQRWKAAKLTSSVTFVLSALYPPSALRDRAAQLLRDEAREILTASGLDIADIALRDHGRHQPGDRPPDLGGGVRRRLDLAERRPVEPA